MFVCLNSKKTESWCHSVCLMAKDSERVKDTQCASSARCSSAVYSLPSILLGVCPSVAVSVCVCLCVFLFILPSFMFSPFLNTIMQSKGPHGTSWCQNDRQKTELKFTKKKREQRWQGARYFLHTDRLEAVFRWRVARERPPLSMCSFMFTYMNHDDKQTVYRKIEAERSVSICPPTCCCAKLCVCLCRHLGYLK